MSNAANATEKQHSLQDSENVHPDKLLTDRSTYIGYLESQLERVTNACLTVQSFDQRLETVTSTARLLEEKVISTIQHVFFSCGNCSCLSQLSELSRPGDIQY